MESTKTKMELIHSLALDSFKEGKTFTFPTKGQSMLPFLHDDDLVTIDKISNIKKGDIVLYRRSNGQYVLHRVRRINKDSTYTMVGDHQRVCEKGITKDQLIAILISYKKKKNNKEYHLKGFKYAIYKLFIKSPVIRWLNSKLFKR